ncbi:unnamed protein product [Brachionus calyciflorus]|uniref:Negative elongation factor E n=1 Tax=Brachionus calyciflorus TaxID=104777 RepID=A0A813P2N1_9BILA|nr:unnamed protein product [Brachionus calyciflorus]
MLINFPNQLTSEEEQLLKKIAKMKKKKKLFSEKKSTSEAHTEETSSTSAGTNTSGLKRSLSNVTPGKKIDAKEAAKKLVQSGIIKFETENKETGFKRSCARKTDSKAKANLNLNPDLGEQTKQISYSSVTSPNSATSPPINSPVYNARFSYSAGDNQPAQYSRTPSFNQRTNFRKNSFQQNQTPNSYDQSGSGYSQPQQQQRFNYNYQQNQQQQGISLYIKANNITEELLRSLFNANVSQAKILSIDVKNNFAFVHVDTKESADIAINELNGKTFQESLFSVSLARPRKTFNRNQNFQNNRPNYSNQGYNYQMRQNSQDTSISPTINYSQNSEGNDSALPNEPRELIKYDEM